HVLRWVIWYSAERRSRLSGGRWLSTVLRFPPRRCHGREPGDAADRASEPPDRPGAAGRPPCRQSRVPVVAKHELGRPSGALEHRPDANDGSVPARDAVVESSVTSGGA